MATREAKMKPEMGFTGCRATTTSIQARTNSNREGASEVELLEEEGAMAMEGSNEEGAPAMEEVASKKVLLRF